MLRLPLKTHGKLIHNIVNDSPINVQLYKRTVKFLVSCSENELPALGPKLAINGSNSTMCQNINFICKKYNCDKYDLLQCRLLMGSHICVTDGNDNTTAQVSGTIREVMLYRDTFAMDSEDYDNLNSVITYLCEN